LYQQKFFCSTEVLSEGKGRGGFEPLPSAEPPALIAARKSREQKNKIIIKIGAVVVIITAAVATLAAFLITRGEHSQSLPPAPPSLPVSSRIMSDKISAVDQVAAVATGNTVFGSRLYQQLKDEPGNIIMSPFSVSGVMAMVAAGAGGDTLSQVQQGMSFPSSEELALGYKDAIPALRTNENFTLEAANSIFAQSGFAILDAYRETLHQHFHAAIQETDYSDGKASARLINDWVEKITQSKIKDLIKPDMLNPLTRLVLVNAIYFKGDWASKFDVKKTTDEDFHLDDGSTKKVPMMRQTKKFQFAILDELSASMLELPYTGDRLSLQLVLPGRGNNLAALEQKLRTADLQQLFDSNKGEDKVAVTLPRFKLEQTIPLTDQLQQLGMTDMFVGGKADFSAIDGSRNLYVSEVVQKAFIEVNEEGSEAAAATGAVMMMRSMPMPPEEFRADRPFLFFLRDKLTGMLLFQGRVSDPSA